MVNTFTTAIPPYRARRKLRTRAVLLDRDGVLTYFDVDAAAAFFRPLLPISLLDLAARWQSTGAIIGFPRSLTEEGAFFAEFWEQIGDEFALTQGQRITLAKFDYTQFVVPYPEVPAVLEKLSTSTLRLGVLSNFSLASLEQSLLATGIARYFHVVCAAPVIGYAKPSARAYELALERLNVEPEECLFFDDEPDCVEGARALGLSAYLVDRRAQVHDLEHFVVADLKVVPELSQATG